MKPLLRSNSIRGYEVIDRGTGETLGSVRKTPDFQIVLWTAYTPDGEKIPGPMFAKRFNRRADAVEAVVATSKGSDHG